MSALRVIYTKGPRILSGPSIKKKKVNICPSERATPPWSLAVGTLFLAES